MKLNFKKILKKKKNYYYYFKEQYFYYIYHIDNGEEIPHTSSCVLSYVNILDNKL